MAKRSTPASLETPAPTVDLTQHLAGHVSRFQTFHGLACKSALELKLAKYFAGLEVNALYDLHAELHGETRGGDTRSDEAETKTDSLSVLKLEDFLEQHLNVTARTARRYRSHFLSITDAAPKIAEKLNGAWRKLALPDAPAPSEDALAVTSLQASGSLNAEAMQAIAEHADEWGLHEIFEIPQRDVTPQPEDEEDDDAAKKAKKAAMIKFWSESVVRRLDQEELHRLPPTVLEAVVHKMEEAATKARQILADKAAKKKAKR